MSKTGSSKIIIDLQNEMKQCANPVMRASGERFFKEPVAMLGLNSAMTKAIGNKYFKLIDDQSKKHVFSLCEELWQLGYMEDTFIACLWSHACHKQFESSDMQIFERWVSTYLNNWASTDGFCCQTVGTLIEKFPGHIETLKKWTQSPNRWVKRAAAVSLIVPARKGFFLDDVFEIALLLLEDRDDMVQKGYGWMLKVAAKKHEQEVFNFVLNHKATMPRTALRYAIEKMPEKRKREAMMR